MDDNVYIRGQQDFIHWASTDEDRMNPYHSGSIEFLEWIRGNAKMAILYHRHWRDIAIEDRVKQGTRYLTPMSYYYLKFYLGRNVKKMVYCD